MQFPQLPWSGAYCVALQLHSLLPSFRSIRSRCTYLVDVLPRLARSLPRQYSHLALLIVLHSVIRSFQQPRITAPPPFRPPPAVRPVLYLFICWHYVRYGRALPAGAFVRSSLPAPASVAAWRWWRTLAHIRSSFLVAPVFRLPPVEPAHKTTRFLNFLTYSKSPRSIIGGSVNYDAPAVGRQ